MPLRTFPRTEEAVAFLSQTHPKKQVSGLVGMTIDLNENGHPTTLSYAIISAEILPASGGGFVVVCGLSSLDSLGPHYLGVSENGNWIVYSRSDKPLDYKIRWHDAPGTRASTEVYT